MGVLRGNLEEEPIAVVGDRIRVAAQKILETLSHHDPPSSRK